MSKILEYMPQDPKSLNKLMEVLNALRKVSHVIEIKENKPIRSLDANAYYWAILTIISISTGEWDRDELHEVCKRKFNSITRRGPKQEFFIIGGSTKNMDTGQFSAYVNKVKAWAMNEWGILIPEAKDIDYKRWMEIKESYDSQFHG